MVKVRIWEHFAEPRTVSAGKFYTQRTMIIGTHIYTYIQSPSIFLTLTFATGSSTLSEPAPPPYEGWLGVEGQVGTRWDSSIPIGYRASGAGALSCPSVCGRRGGWRGDRGRRDRVFHCYNERTWEREREIERDTERQGEMEGREQIKTERVNHLLELMM